jgi:predicted TIM-barrel fold metal-dependent hydrolase
MDRLRVIDVDAHVAEPPDLWDRYLEPAFREQAPRWVLDNQGRRRLLVAGRLKPYVPFPPGPALVDTTGRHDAKTRLADMDREGIEIMAMYPTVGLFLFGIGRVDVTAALCRAYNDWACDYCSADPRRLLAPVLLPQLDVHESVVELRRGLDELGARAAMLRPNPIGGRMLDDPAFDPLWELLAEHDAPLVLHEGTTQDVPQLGSERTENFLYRHMMSHAFEQQAALLALICGGVLERHPGLRVLIVEAGVAWVPYWLERMDHHVEKWGFASTPLALAPSEYFRRQCFVSADAGEKLLPLVISAIGDDSVCFSTDYPHPDHAFGGIVAGVRARADLGEASKRKLLGENAARLFGMPAAAPSTSATS